MNQSLLKTFAPAARIKFREAMTSRAKLLGLSPDQPPVEAQKAGNQVFIGGLALPADSENQRQELAKRFKAKGWESVIDEAAYTWFNRLSALRYMEVHGFIPQGVRVLTPIPGATQPEILTKAHTLSFDTFSKSQIIELKMEGTKDEELYRRLILASCEGLHHALPQLFPVVREDLEILLPENLLRTGSLLDWFVNELPDSEWQEIEVLGWLYQYYISEVKELYMNRKSAYGEDEIATVTQLFTPKWIVKYLVENSLGRTWMLNHPHSSLKSEMTYYVNPTDQSAGVETNLRQIFDGSIDPESIRVIDPAMGSGHILVTTYETLREIYIERGYTPQQYARLILQKNLAGLDIDLRATEIACFALMMKAREDDPTILNAPDGLELNLLSFRDCSDSQVRELMGVLNPPHPLGNHLKELLEVFKNATIYGSLISVPVRIQQVVPAIKVWLNQVVRDDDFLRGSRASEALGYVRTAELLSQDFTNVISNPPYVGRNRLPTGLLDFIDSNFAGYSEDLFAAFVYRFTTQSKGAAIVSFMTPFTWMFLSSYETMRSDFIEKMSILTLIRPEYHAFFDSAYVPLVVFSLLTRKVDQYRSTFIDLDRFKSAEAQAPNAETAARSLDCSWRHELVADEMKAIEGSPFAFWLSSKMRAAFTDGVPLSRIAPTRQGLKTGNNDLFLRMWFEVSTVNTALHQEMDRKWFPCSKGGKFRKWYGNHEYVLNWAMDGKELKGYTDPVTGKILSRPQNTQYFFKGGMTWSTITISHLSMRILPKDFVFESTGSICVLQDEREVFQILPILNSKIVNRLILAIAPTLNYGEGSIGKIPLISVRCDSGEQLVRISKLDWDSFETSWEFRSLPFLPLSDQLSVIRQEAIHTKIASTWHLWREVGAAWTRDVKTAEEANNMLYIAAYGLQDELTPEVPIDQVTLFVNPAHRYKPKKPRKALDSETTSENFEMTDESQVLDHGEGERRMREDGARELISYTIGCLMGRYSLDKPGLIYAEAGGVRFDPAHYTTFPADDDGIVPVTDYQWDESDAAVRVQDFINVVWGTEHLQENLSWVAENLGVKGTELPLETLRRYLSGDFYKDHLQTYKRRPIYWKFSSGKEKAFEALVYLHRYNDGTLSRMRMQYVVPLTGQLRNKLANTEQQAKDAGSTADRKRFEKEYQTLQKKLSELAAFDEKLRHYADQSIVLDLDDGVRVNYGKFGDLLSNVKDVVGKAED
jgi:hypothetical protein